jgi:hypothetical protein
LLKLTRSSLKEGDGLSRVTSTSPKKLPNLPVFPIEAKKQSFYRLNRQEGSATVAYVKSIAANQDRIPSPFFASLAIRDDPYQGRTSQQQQPAFEAMAPKKKHTAQDLPYGGTRYSKDNQTPLVDARGNFEQKLDSTLEAEKEDPWKMPAPLVDDRGNPALTSMTDTRPLLVSARTAQVFEGPPAFKADGTRAKERTPG